MNIKMILVICFITLFSNGAIAGKKRCKSLLVKLQNIQAQQRQGYSAKKGASLQARLEKMRDKWWQCENTSKYSQSKKKQKKKIKLHKAINKRVKTNTYTSNSHKVVKPFTTSQAIVIKSRFKGKKQQAWLNYYQQPKKCNRAKTTQVFAFCVENKAIQQDEFVRQYRD